MGIEEKIKLEDASSTIAVNLNVSRTSFQIEDSPDSHENCQNSSLMASNSNNTVLDPLDTLNQSSLVSLVEKQSIFNDNSNKSEGSDSRFGNGFSISHLVQATENENSFNKNSHIPCQLSYIDQHLDDIETNIGKTNL